MKEEKRTSKFKKKESKKKKRKKKKKKRKCFPPKVVYLAVSQHQIDELFLLHRRNMLHFRPFIDIKVVCGHIISKLSPKGVFW